MTNSDELASPAVRGDGLLPIGEMPRRRAWAMGRAWQWPISAMAARQGTRGRRVLYVLVASLLLSAAYLIGLQIWAGSEPLAQGVGHGRHLLGVEHRHVVVAFAGARVAAEAALEAVGPSDHVVATDLSPPC